MCVWGGGLASTRASLPARETQVWAEEQVRKIKWENGRGVGGTGLRPRSILSAEPVRLSWWRFLVGPVPSASAWCTGPSAPRIQVSDG